MEEKFLNKSFSFVIADSDIVMQKMLISALRSLGYQNIYYAHDGQEAWEIIQNNKIDIILSEFQMPRINGLELLTKVRSSDQYWDTPFIMVSSESRKSRIVHTTEEEIDAYVVKPLTTNTVAKYVDQVLTNRYTPDLYYSALYCAKSNLRRGEKSEALEAFQEANAYNPSRTTPYFYMAQILEDFNYDDMALENYKKCDDKSHNMYVRAIDGLSRIYLKKEHYEAAAETLQKAVDVSPANTERSITLGKCYFEIGDIAASKKCLTKAAAMVVGDIEKIEEIATICFEFDFINEAEQMLNKIYDKGVRELKVFNQFGLMSKQKGEYEKAQTYYNAALRISPSSDVINYNCAVLSIEMKNYPLAIAHLKRALLHHSEFKVGQELLLKLNEFLASGNSHHNLEMGPLDVLPSTPE